MKFQLRKAVYKVELCLGWLSILSKKKKNSKKQPDEKNEDSSYNELRISLEEKKGLL